MNVPQGLAPPRMIYFFADQNKDHNHPIPVHRNSQLPKRTRIISFLLRPVCRAIHAGAKIIAPVNAIAKIYFKISIISGIYIPYFALLPSSSSMRNN